MRFLRKQERSARVPEVVEAVVGQTGPLQEWGERTLPEVRGVDRGALLRGEDEALVLPEAGEVHHLAKLALAVGPDDLQGASREPDGAAALPGLRFPEGQPLTLVYASERAPDVDGAVFEVNVATSTLAALLVSCRWLQQARKGLRAGRLAPLREDAKLRVPTEGASPSRRLQEPSRRSRGCGVSGSTSRPVRAPCGAHGGPLDCGTGES